MEEEQNINDINQNNEENQKDSSSNSTLKNIVGGISDTIKDNKYRSRKSSVGSDNSDSSNTNENSDNNTSSNIPNSAFKDNKSTNINRTGTRNIVNHPVNKFKNNLKSQALNQVSNLHPALKAATMLNSIRQNKNSKKNEQINNDSDNSLTNKGSISNSGNIDNEGDNDVNNEKAFDPVSSLLGSKFKSKFNFFGLGSLKSKLILFASGSFLALFLILLVPIIIVSAFDSLFSIGDFFTGSNSNSGNISNIATGSYLEWAIDIANDDSHGYSQCNRMGPDYDCSSFVWYSLLNSGYSKDEIGSYPFNTFGMGNILTKIGFKKYFYVESQLQTGDILLRSGHTGIYVGNGQIVDASIAENNLICGKVGDQTGKEISVRNNTGNWTAYFRKGGI